MGTSSVLRICWGHEGSRVGWDRLVVLQVLALCPTFLHLKHRPSLIHFAHSCGVSFFNFMKSTSMVSGCQVALVADKGRDRKLL